MPHFHVGFLRSMLLVACILGLTQSCLDHAVDLDDLDIVAANHAARRASRPGRKIALHNVRIFDGTRILPPSTVIIDGGFIGINPFGAEHIDGKGNVLLPGFIDTHCHPRTIEDLTKLSDYGITTAFLQSGTSPAVRESLTNHPGITDLGFASTPAIATNDTRVVPPAILQQGSLISSPAKVPGFMQNQTSSDWVKILAFSDDIPTVTEPVLDALVRASHGKGMDTVCHATTYEQVRQALVARVDQVHHSPVDKALDKKIAQLYRAEGQPNCPTLVAMLAITESLPPMNYNYTAAAESVTVLYKAGVPILAGSDAHSQANLPFQVPFGNSMHRELELLVQAGLSNVDALRAATVLPAKHYGLGDRGRVLPGMRADLMLVGGNPLGNISHTRDIKRIWVAGVEHKTTTSTEEGLEGFASKSPLPGNRLEGDLGLVGQFT